MCRWMGSHFYTGLTIMGSHFQQSLILEWGGTFFGFFGVRQFFVFMVSKRTRMFVPQMKSKLFFIRYKKWVNS